MRAAVVGVGDELLSGLVVNTNAAMAGELLLAAGVPVVRSACVSDEEDEVVDVLRWAAEAAEVVICTGGLGPTHDDRTREAIARLLGVPLERDEGVVEAIRERFRSFGREMPEANAQQGDVPRGARAIPNPWGTAPGIRAERDGVVFYAIPGVPGEARRMLTEQILPELARRGDVSAAIRSVELRCVGLPESELAGHFSDLAARDNPKLAFLPGGGEVRLRFIASGPTPDACEELLAEAEALVRDRVGDAVYGTGEDSMEGVVGGLLRERGRTVATAESCTAGLLAGRLADVPGASDYLSGGLVAYRTEAKRLLLGAEELPEGPPVSEGVTRRMAEVARERLGSDFGLGVTCIAGPDPQDGVGVGTTIIALAAADGTETRELRLPGDRAQIRLFATTFALEILRRRLLAEE